MGAGHRGGGGAFNRSGSNSPIQKTHLRMSMAANERPTGLEPQDISPVLGASFGGGNVADRVAQMERRQSNAHMGNQGVFGNINRRRTSMHQHAAARTCIHLRALACKRVHIHA